MRATVKRIERLEDIDHLERVYVDNGVSGIVRSGEHQVGDTVAVYMAGTQFDRQLVRRRVFRGHACDCVIARLSLPNPVRHAKLHFPQEWTPMFVDKRVPPPQLRGQPFYALRSCGGKRMVLVHTPGGEYIECTARTRLSTPDPDVRAVRSRVPPGYAFYVEVLSREKVWLTGAVDLVKRCFVSYEELWRLAFPLLSRTLTLAELIARGPSFDADALPKHHRMIVRVDRAFPAFERGCRYRTRCKKPDDDDHERGLSDVVV